MRQGEYELHDARRYKVKRVPFPRLREGQKRYLPLDESMFKWLMVNYPQWTTHQMQIGELKPPAWTPELLAWMLENFPEYTLSLVVNESEVKEA